MTTTVRKLTYVMIFLRLFQILKSVTVISNGIPNLLQQSKYIAHFRKMILNTPTFAKIYFDIFILLLIKS